ncbi:MAG TPA: class I SAM-dependent methyltransferase [Steroidobacteraceae bacterium]
MTDEASVCRLCGASRIVRLGCIPDSDYFAGRVLARALEGGSLWRCISCQSMFRHPVLRPATYLDLYADGVAEAWSAGHGRQDLEIICRLIARHNASGRVLDVGCGSGGFLATLPASLTKCGVEPSVAAACVATGRGVSILGQTPQDLPAHAQFDVITIIDVIEHVVDPAQMLDELLPHLAPGGCLIVGTGDPTSTPWQRIFRSRFWYSCFPEHISFPSPQYFRVWQQSRGLQPPAIVRTRYRQLPMWRWALFLAAQVLYALSPACVDWLGRTAQELQRMPHPRRRLFSPGSLGVFTDHQVVMIQRPARGATRFPAS